MKSTLIASALLASLTNAFEEHSMEMEDTIISGLDSVYPSGEGTKFSSYTSHLGQPAMHEELIDGKTSHYIK